MKQEQDVKEPGRNMKKVQIKSTEVGATVIDGTKECIDEIKEQMKGTENCKHKLWKIALMSGRQKGKEGTMANQGGG